MVFLPIRDVLTCLFSSDRLGKAICVPRKVCGLGNVPVSCAIVVRVPCRVVVIRHKRKGPARYDVFAVMPVST